MDEVPVQLVVATFSGEGAAGDALKLLIEARREKLIDIQDAAVIRRDENNKIHIRDRITSYNVCYTKLLRTRVTASTSPPIESGISVVWSALTSMGMARQKLCLLPGLKKRQKLALQL